MAAAQNGHSNVVETLLQHGASVDTKKTVSAHLTEPPYVSITNVWYLIGTDLYKCYVIYEILACFMIHYLEPVPPSQTSHIRSAAYLRHLLAK